MPTTPSLTQRICGWILRTCGWTVVFRWPPAPKCVVIFYPHTSNWDFIWGVLVYLSLGWQIRWCGKDNWFRWPLGILGRALGGIPVNRRERTGFVGQLRREYERAQELYVAITPEGTRSRTDHWKSGFYHLALATDMLVGLGFVDYPSKRIGVDTYVALSGREEEDLANFRAYYADKRGFHPQLQGDIRFAPARAAGRESLPQR
ncbi:MAG: 1-acyl-sn-glycerol-3-phosphate acyltransferase [Pseudomonadota bacterium]